VAEALNEFGLAEMAHLVERANARKAFLDQLEALCDEPSTLESQMHIAIERNLWLLGAELSLFSSNKTLRRQAENLGKQYEGEKGNVVRVGVDLAKRVIQVHAVDRAGPGVAGAPCRARSS
jgi:hypothetical protein